MKEVLKNVHRPAKHVLIIGWIIIATMLVASTVFYIGAGEIFDYYFAIGISEKLLARIRPLSVAVFVVSTGMEYYLKNKKNSSG